MVVIRNVFHLRFGKAKEAVALLKENVAIIKGLGSPLSPRILTDLTGRFYTVVLELTANAMSDMEKESPRIMADPGFQANYQKLVPLVESGSREIFTIIE